MSGILFSSVGRKVAMALSALFLMFFLLQHLTINLASVFSPQLFNEWSHFMGTNFFVQFLLQPVLILAVLFHFVMGFILEIKNKKARDVSYAKNKSFANTSWMSRNMIWSGLAILAFLILHFIDFWVPEIKYKYIDALPSNPNRYFEELQHKFVNPLRVGAYLLAFVLLSLHLLHGFQSAFQSMGANQCKKSIKLFGKLFAVIVPLGFVGIALFHHFNH